MYIYRERDVTYLAWKNPTSMESWELLPFEAQPRFRCSAVEGVRALPNWQGQKAESWHDSHDMPRHATTCHDIPSKLTCPSSRDAMKQQLQIISSKDKTQREKACDRHLNRTGHLVARQGLLRVQGGTSLERETGQPAILLSLFSPGSLYQACPWCRGMFKLICVQYVQSRHQTSPDSNGAWICGAIEQRICTVGSLWFFHYQNTKRAPPWGILSVSPKKRSDEKWPEWPVVIEMFWFSPRFRSWNSKNGQTKTATFIHVAYWPQYLIASVAGLGADQKGLVRWKRWL